MSYIPEELQQLQLNPQEWQYLNLQRDIQQNGQVKTDRTGTGTLSDFGKMMRFNLQQGLPILTTKKIHLKSIIHENIWFLSGSTNIQYLKDNGVTIWDEWADANGELGPVYGKQWRRWEDIKIILGSETREAAKLFQQGYNVLGSMERDGLIHLVLRKEYDQITDALNLIKHNPDSRRIVVNAWNVADIAGMKLPPCHAMYQFYVSDLTLTERVKMCTTNYRHKFDDETWCARVSHLRQEEMHQVLDAEGVPRKKLSCMLYQRSLN